MKKIIVLICAYLLVFQSFSVFAENQKPYFKEVGVHDPSIIKDGDLYYVFGTHGAAAKSSDLINWEYFVDNDVYNHSLFKNVKKNFKVPFEWTGNANTNDIGDMGIWAPDVYYNPNYIKSDGKKGAYLMYFSLSTGQDDGINNHFRSLIGLAVSDEIEGPYEYVETVIYTGFHDKEGKSHYKNTDFNIIFPNTSPRSDYFKEDGTYDFDMYPNAIDPAIVETHDNKLYMVYGSWHAGVWVIELDKAIGLPKRDKTYKFEDDIKNIDPYFGTQISGGYWTSGEGPYIQYHKDSGYYHLYVTYGGLMQNDTYNMRFFRSKNIDGPYEDIDGKNPIFKAHGSNDRLGNRLMGSFEFTKEQAIDAHADFFGYRVPGHNSVLYNEDGKDFIFFHTRFKDKGESHELRVHQLFFDEDGWPLIAPQRFNNETLVEENSDIEGTYLIIQQEQDNSKLSKESIGISLEKDGTVIGAMKGSWSFEDGTLSLTLGNASYKGIVLKQNTPITGHKTDLTFSLIGKQGRTQGDSVLGIKISDLNHEAILDQAIKDLKPPRLNDIQANIKLPTQTYAGINVKWHSSEQKVISSSGKVQRQEYPTELKLSAKLKYGGKERTKDFTVNVVSIEGETYQMKRKYLIFLFIFITILAIIYFLAKFVRTINNIMIND